MAYLPTALFATSGSKVKINKFIQVDYKYILNRRSHYQIGSQTVSTILMQISHSVMLTFDQIRLGLQIFFFKIHFCENYYFPFFYNTGHTKKPSKCTVIMEWTEFVRRPLHAYTMSCAARSRQHRPSQVLYTLQILIWASCEWRDGRLAIVTDALTRIVFVIVYSPSRSTRRSTYFSHVRCVQ